MKRCKQYLGMATAIAMLLIASCQEVTDRIEPGSDGELKFSPSLSEAQTSTRAGESENSVLQAASKAGEDSTPRIEIDTYTGKPGESQKKYFSDKLGYFTSGNYWDLNSGTTRFLPPGGMNLYAYYATNSTKAGVLDSKWYTPIPEKSPADYPKLKFDVAAADDKGDAALNQVDLIAAKVEGIASPEIVIPFRHILSQINFGVKGIDGHQITVTNIRINNVKNSGSFDYKTWGWTPGAQTTTYPYHFPNRIKGGNADTGLGKDYQTLGTPDDSKNTYLFGDGGKFGPGSDATFLYAQANPAYATKKEMTDRSTPPLYNSLMLLPQKIKDNDQATVTFDYEIKSKEDNKLIRESENNTVRLDAYYDWEPNFRYVYLFKFTEPLVTFDVLVEPWQYYDGDDGIIGSEELNSNTLFQKFVRPIQSDGSYSVPLGPLISDFICDWSQYTLDSSFVSKPNQQSFTLSFDDAPFKNGKSVIIKPPFGFKAVLSSLSEKATVTANEKSTVTLSKKGIVTFSPITSYYSTTAALNSAIRGGIGDHEFYVSDAVKLDKINFTGSTTAASSLTLHSLTPYDGSLYPEWQFSDGKAVYYPNDFALTSGSIPYSYTIYTVKGLKAVFDWMNTDNTPNPGGTNTTATYTQRMQTNINLAPNGKYNLADVYKSSSNSNPQHYVPIGNMSIPYSGTFDGKGATVENLYINSYDQDHTGQGLFGAISKEVKFINLKDAFILSGGNYVGGIAGKSSDGGKITGCSVSGSIHGGFVGGIVGEATGTVFSCSSTATVTTFSEGNNGGIVGVNWSTIQGCYSTSSGINITGKTKSFTETNFYVASTEVGTNSGATRVPSIAALNGKIKLLNAVGAAQNTGAHFVSGNLNETPPSIVAGNPTVNPTPGGVLKGTFIQNWFALGWSQTDWDREMALLATLGMEYLVIDQVMVSSGAQYMSWYEPLQDVLVNAPSSGSINSGTALEKCMTACRAHGIKLFVGTFFDSRYWDHGVAVDGKKEEWYKCIETANNVMNDLTDLYFNGTNSKRSNFTDVLAGWYFPYEVDDYNFQTPAKQDILKYGIKLAMECRNKLAANAKKPYLFSPFMNGNGPYTTKGAMTAGDYAILWGDIIRTTGFQSEDILSPQDCIGTGKLTIEDLGVWMPKLQEAATSNGVKFWVNVELLGPGADISFLTTRQIPASKPYAAQFISFSYPIHYSPDSDSKVGDHNAYKAYYDAQ